MPCQLFTFTPLRECCGTQQNTPTWYKQQVINYECHMESQTVSKYAYSIDKNWFACQKKLLFFTLSETHTRICLCRSTQYFMADLMTELCRPDSAFTSMSMRAVGSRTNSESLLFFSRIATGIVCSLGSTRLTRWKIFVGAVAVGIISSAMPKENHEY